MSSQRESITVLEECIDLQKRKSQDYQNPNSNIVQAMHYRRGISTIHDMINQKLLRAQSLLEPQENGESRDPNFESLEDTYKDLINYASFAVSWLRGKMEGQNPNLDIFNRKLGQHEDAKYMLPKDAKPEPQFLTEEEPIKPSIDQIVARTYTKEVSSFGPMSKLYDEKIYSGEAPCTDPVIAKYVQQVAPEDVGDRLEQEFAMAASRTIEPKNGTAKA